MCSASHLTALVAVTAAVLFVLLPSIDGQSSENWKPLFPVRRSRAGEPTYIYTKGDLDWSTARYTVQDRHNFILQVKACSSAVIALNFDTHVTNESLLIYLGYPDVNTSSIRIGNSVQYEAYTQWVVHCNEYRTFWIQWLGGLLEVGHGPTVGEHLFMFSSVVPRRNLYSLALSSTNAQAAVWQIKENTGDYLSVHTADDYNYGKLWKSIASREYFYFSVRACNDIHLVLSTQLGKLDSDVYEIVIGGWENTKSVIRTSLQSPGFVAEYLEQGVLHCDEYRDFWVSWNNKTIKVGKGHMYPVNTMLSWYDLDFKPVRFMAISAGWGSTGHWHFNENRETMSDLWTPVGDLSLGTGSLYNTSFLEIPYRTYFPFLLRTCGEARILLMEHVHEVNIELDVEINLGSEGNTKICIGYEAEFGCLAEYKTTKVLSCHHYDAFWISWHDYKISLGRGLIYNTHVLIANVSLPSQMNITGIALASLHYGAWWRFRDNIVAYNRYHTPSYFNDYQASTIWRNIETQQAVWFKVKAANDVHLALSPVQGVDLSRDSWYYSIVISGWGNTLSAVRKSNGAHEGAELVYLTDKVDTTGLLSADRYIDLWVSWWDNYLMVGTGPEEGKNVFLQCPLQDIIDIRYMAFSTGWGAWGHFTFPEDLGDWIHMITNGTSNPYGRPADVWVNFAQNFYFHTFNIIGPKDAQVLIASRPDNITFYTHYKVVFGAEENTKVFLYHGDSLVKSADMITTLHRDSRRSFWIFYDGKKIEVGYGYTYNHDKLIEYSQGEPMYNVTAMGFTSDANNVVKWEVYHGFYEPTFYTPVHYGYNHLYTSVDHAEELFFAVRAGSDVHVILSERYGEIYTNNLPNRKAYEIVLGGWYNTKSVIREWVSDEHGERLVHRVEASTPGLLLNTTFVSFGITWANGGLVVNLLVTYPNGSVARTEKLMDYHPVNPRIVRSASFSTGYDWDGEWMLDVIGEVIATDIDEQTPPVPAQPEASGGLSAGAIVGIVLGALSLALIVGMVVTVVLSRRGAITTPNVLREPVQGSGFVNPSVESQPVQGSAAGGFDEVIY